MSVLRDDIAAFERMQADLQAEHGPAWVVFRLGKFEGVFPDFEAAASEAVDRFDEGPYLIRQLGAGSIPLSGGMIFTPAHILGASGL
jgi:hypothetical protein